MYTHGTWGTLKKGMYFDLWQFALSRHLKYVYNVFACFPLYYQFHSLDSNLTV